MGTRLSSAVATPDATVTEEVEWQFVTDDLATVEPRVRRRAETWGFQIDSLAEQEIHDAYLDTVDWRVYRAGYALRVRAQAGRFQATLKSLTKAVRGLRRRLEISEALTGDEPEAAFAAPGPVGERIRAVVSSSVLRTLFEVHTQRSRLRLDRSGAPEAEIALDETRIFGPDGRELQRLQRVEVEAVGEPTDSLLAFVRDLESSRWVTIASTSKFEAGLEALRLRPPQAL